MLLSSLILLATTVFGDIAGKLVFTICTFQRPGTTISDCHLDRYRFYCVELCPRANSSVHSSGMHITDFVRYLDAKI